MGCLITTPIKGKAIKKKTSSDLGEVGIFTPGLCIPVAESYSLPMSYSLPNGYLERLSALRNKITAIVSGEASALLMGRRTAPEKQLGLWGLSIRTFLFMDKILIF